MLFAAVVVCLMGIMYQANEQLAYGGAHDGITAVVMIDIIVACVPRHLAPLQRPTAPLTLLLCPL